MRILLLKQEWGERILSGEKTWEIRGSDTKIRGRIAVAYSKSSKKFGEATLSDSFPLTEELFENNPEKHCLPGTWEDVLKVYKNPVVWELTEAVLYDEPVPYIHPRGAVIWVNEE